MNALIHQHTAAIQGHIAITPMRCDLAAHDALDDLKHRLE